MRTVWDENGEKKAVTAPLSLIVTAFAPVTDVRKTLTPELRTDIADTVLVLVDLGRGQQRLGASALAQVYGAIGNVAPDVDAASLKAFFNGVQSLNAKGLLLAYHDRSDGGLLATVAEMSFAARCGVTLELDAQGEVLPALFNEELGAVLQVRRADLAAVQAAFGELAAFVRPVGVLAPDEAFSIHVGANTVFAATRAELQQAWSETSFRMQSLRDNADCAAQEFALIDSRDEGLQVALSYDVNANIAAPFINKGLRPRMAVLREQGVNGHVEMAAAFDRAGFESVDVHMSDIIAGRVSLADFKGLVACGGFSYGDVLGAGGGWAKSVLFNARARDNFEAFFTRGDTFSLGVCNGCQMMSQLKDLIPGAEHWPRFMRNTSEQFEARTVMVEVKDSPSVLLAGMAGSRMPIAVAHGEGRVSDSAERIRALADSGLVALAYSGEAYPHNPNGSPFGITGVTSRDGRATIVMPHPERVFRAVQHSWRPAEWEEDGSWMRLFRNARVFVG